MYINIYFLFDLSLIPLARKPSPERPWGIPAHSHQVRSPLLVTLLVTLLITLLVALLIAAIVARLLAVDVALQIVVVLAML